MKTRTGAAASAGMFALLAGAISPNLNVLQEEADLNPTIVIIGGSVSGTEMQAGPFKLSRKDRPSGPTMAAGFSAFLQNIDPKFDAVKFEWRDDLNQPGEATRIAEEIVTTRPEVVAVVGHTQSNTTAAALPFYAAAGIPLVLPVATSVDFGFDPGSGDAHPESGWCLRREIADDAYQVLAIEAVISHKKKHRCLLIVERDNQSRAYVEALSYMIEQRIGPKIVARMTVGRGEWDGDYLAEEIVAQKVDIVCFLGYPEMARRVLFNMRPDRLRAAYSIERKIPLVLPDACIRMQQEWSDTDPETIITFPIKITENPFKGEELKSLYGSLRWNDEDMPETNTRLAFEVTGRNSAKSLINALKKLYNSSTPISRRSLRQKLREEGRASVSYYAFKTGKDGGSLETMVTVSDNKPEESSDIDRWFSSETVADLRKEALGRATDRLPNSRGAR